MAVYFFYSGWESSSDELRTRMTTSIDIRFIFPILIYYDILVDSSVIAVVIVLGIVGHLS